MDRHAPVLVSRTSVRADVHERKPAGAALPRIRRTIPAVLTTAGPAPAAPNLVIASVNPGQGGLDHEQSTQLTRNLPQYHPSRDNGDNQPGGPGGMA